MSLHEVSAATAIDQETEEESKIHQWRSMMLNQVGTGPSNANRDTENLPGDQAWSKRDRADENEVNGVSNRRKTSLKRVDHKDQNY